MKKIRKLIATFIVTFMAISLLNLPTQAASISVSAPGTVSPNQSFSVTINVGSLGGQFSVSTSGGFTVSQSSVWMEEGGSTTITATAPSSGSGSISVSGTGLIDFSTGARVDNASGGASITVSTPTPPSGGGNDTTGGGSSSGGGSSTGGSTGGGNTSGGSTTDTTTPTTPEETPKSSNNSLSALTVSAGTLSPEFNADTTEYTVTLPADATGILINASAQDGKATVSGTGDHSLRAGLNEFIINVTAENGAGKNYFVRVNVDEAPLVYTTHNNQKLGVVRNTDEVGIPSNFEETKVTIDGQEVKAWHSNLLNKTIVYLVNDAGEKNFYIYEDGKISSVFKSMSILGKNIYLVDVPEAMKTMTGFSFGEVEIDGKKLPGWTFTDARFANYMLIYVMDEQGNMKLYQYEKTENSLQLYSGAAAISQDVYESTLKEAKSKTDTQQIIIYILVATTVVGVGAAGFAFYQWIQVRKLGTTTYRKKFDYSSDEEKSTDDEK